MNHWTWTKMCLKSRKSKLREMVRRRSGQVRNVLTDFPKRLGTQIGRYIAAICIAGGGEAVAISCISAKIWRWNQISKNVLENSKIKVARNGRGKVRTSATSLRTSQNASEHKSGDTSPSSALPVMVKLWQSAAFLIPSSDFSWNAADYSKFTATGNADGGDISPDLCSEAF